MASLPLSSRTPSNWLLLMYRFPTDDCETGESDALSCLNPTMETSSSSLPILMVSVSSATALIASRVPNKIV
ncbi:MAG: hypothetical protein ACLTGI_01920 [Hoylesella buccalis]